MVERYTDWRHTRIIGAPPEAGTPYLPEARKLLGQVFEAAAFNKLGVHRMKKVLDDGTVIVAEKHGEIPRITIYPMTGQPVAPPPPKKLGLVVWARDMVWQTGIRETKPQQIITPGTTWATYTFKDDILAGRTDGTYAGTFRDGIEHAGNIDWIGSDGVRINWYGPSLRYWFDAYRKPSAQYAKWVFLNGVVLLNIAQYASDNAVSIPEQYVMGAALVGQHLYVMQAAIADFPATYDAAEYPPEAAHVWISPPYPQGTATLRLARYTVVRNEAAIGNASMFQIAAGSMTTLWTYTGRGLVNPWVFAPDASVCETFAMPDELRTIVTQDNKVSPATYTFHVTPSASSDHVSVAIDKENEEAIETVTVLTADATLWNTIGDHKFVIAADYTREGERIELKHVASLTATTRDCYLQFGDDPPVPLAADTGTPEINDLRVVDIRERMIVVNRSVGLVDSLAHDTAIYRAGILHQGNTFTLNAPIWWLRRYASRGPNDLRGHFAVEWPTENPNGTIATISPMVFVSGVQCHTTLTNGATGSSIRWARSGKHYETFSNDEIVGWCAYFDVSGFLFTPWSTSGPLVGIMSTIAGYSRALDADGMRVADSLAVDPDGEFLASVILAVSIESPGSGAFWRKAGMGQVSSGPPLGELTGIPGNPGPIANDSQISKYPYDARYSTIWALGKWPNI